MKYAYEDLSEGDFEGLIVLLCQELLGIAVQGFTKGPDGGRDAKFVGTAQRFPSFNSPWKGIVIIQAKHTDGFNRSFSEKDFFSSDAATCIINVEAERIRKLRKAKEVDHYILFSNRRLSGGTESTIRNHLSAKCELPLESIYLCDIEQIELYLKRYPNVVEMADIRACLKTSNA